MIILVCNAGSTSLKYKLLRMPEEEVLTEKKYERVSNYEEGIRNFLDSLDPDNVPDAVAFKTVLSKDHYGVHFIDEDVIRGMEEYKVGAPAHNTFYLEAINTFKRVMPEIPQIGVFETAFHQTIPRENYIYPVPYEWYEKNGLRKYGYHGASHEYVTSILTLELGESYKAISCHLGGSGSISAIIDGKCYDTSFGMSLQCGIPQSNRCGNIDPYLIFFMHKYAGMTYEDIEKALARESGLLGISGVSNDLRDVIAAAEQGNERAQLAFNIYAKEVTGYIGRYAAMMGGLDAVAFAGGIGENCRELREYVMSHLAFIGNVRELIVPTDEELVVARKSYKMLIG